ncbi:DUF3137 domain-containing protein [Kribbella sp. NPDC055071]
MIWEALVGVGMVCVALGIPAIYLWIAVSEENAKSARSLRRARRGGELRRLGWVSCDPVPGLVKAAADIFYRGEPGECFSGEFGGRSAYVMDYSYTLESGRSAEMQHVFLISLDLGVRLPELRATPKGFHGESFKGPDLEFESRRFNKVFRIQCEDRRYASAVLNPRMMECMMRNRRLVWQIRDRTLINWGSNPFDAEDVLARVGAMHELVELIPAFVFQDYAQDI